MRRFISLCFAAMAVAVFLGGCSKDSKEDITFQKGEVPDEVFSDFVTQESDSGLVQWTLKAPKASRFSKRKVVMLEKPVVQFFDKQGNLQTTLVSNAGEYSEETRDMLAYGNVVVHSVDGDVLETDSLWWDNTSNKIFSNSFVKLTRGKDVVTGYGLECEPDLNLVDIKRDVKATIIEGADQLEEGNAKPQAH
jgi:LPS export ABC transporter protein LptC